MQDSGSFRESRGQERVLWPNAAQVTAQLQRRGVPRSDVDDLCQEVLLVAVRRRPQLDHDAAAAAWLAEACDYVARAYRRKAHRRREIFEWSDTQIFESLPAVNELGGSELAADQLHAALARLNARERELLALRLAADMPLRTLADLHECDVKTLRKRLQLAERKLRQHLLQGGATALAALGPKQLMRVGAPGASPPLEAPPQPPGAAPEVAVGACDDTLILAWQGSFSEQALGRLLACGEVLVKEHGSRLRCLNVIDPGWSVPRFDERARISEAIRFLDRYCVALGLVGAQDSFRVLEQILRGLGFLEQAHYSFGSFESVGAGAEWLVRRRAEPGAATQARAERLVRAVSDVQAEAREPMPASGPRRRAQPVVHGVGGCVAIASLDNVLVTSWRGPVTQASVNFLVATADALRNEHGPLAHLSVVEPESPTPRFAERQRLLEVARHCKRNLAVFSFVAQMSNVRIAEQILRGLGFLTRTHLLMCGTRSEAEGADWIIRNGFSPDSDPARGRERILELLATVRALHAGH
ncbi:MAG TPA: sigma-70 family RNA polymerase sigma factor [Polyangiaceae bacterium]|nr:sigma-70 family RNA polymerase sigma factor [Polyangiaceae bacterium]